MQIGADYTYPDGSTISVSIHDGMDGFDPLRLADMAVELRNTMRLVLADAAHEQAEHEQS